MSLFGSLPLPSKQQQPSSSLITSNQQQQQETTNTPITSSASAITTSSEEINNESGLKSLLEEKTLSDGPQTDKPKGMNSFSLLVPSSTVKKTGTPKINPFKSSSVKVKKIGTIIDHDETMLNKKPTHHSKESQEDEYDPLFPNKYEDYLLKKSTRKIEVEEKMDNVIDEEDDELILSSSTTTNHQPTTLRTTTTNPVSGKSSSGKSTISFNLQKKTHK